MAQKLATVVYDHPTPEQVSDFHMVLRKFAHLFLFGVLGGVGTWVFAVTLPKTSGWMRGYYVVLSTLITVGCGFIDEWHKQFIAGRHFDLGETKLNIMAGIAGVCIAVLMMLISRIIRWAENESL